MTKRFIEFAPAPGIVRDLTTNAATGNWVDCDKIRFRKGFPEKLGGWVKTTEEMFQGICRALFAWTTLDGTNLLAVGTNLKYYLESSGTLTDITPIRANATLGTDPLLSTVGSGVVTVTDTAHGAAQDDFVIISGATAFDDLTTGDLNKEHQIIEIVDADTYRIDTGGTATAGGVSGGGSSVDVDYLLSSGPASLVFGSGWGAGSWSHSGGWSSPASSVTLSGYMRLWSQDNFGEDLLFAPRFGAIYRYDASSPGRGVAISTEMSASDVPASVLEVLVSPNERIVFALGCPPISSGTLDPLLVRWTDYENYLNWTPDTDSAAGGVRLSAGSTILTGLKTKQEILVWTDVAMFGFQFVGGTDIYQSYLIDGNTDLIGPMAKAQFLGRVFWMGKRGFYTYDGRVLPLVCPFEDYIFRDMNRDAAFKIVCGTNALFNEVWWFYASEDSDEPDRYVIYNVAENVWYYGTLDRTFWYDRGLANYPRAAGADGYIYYHEFGLDDGSQNPPAAITSFIESAPVEIGGSAEMGRGDRIAFADVIIPDVTFRSSTASAPTLDFIFKERDYPGLVYEEEDDTVTKGATVDRYTKKLDVRLRARALAVRVQNDEAGADWRLGVQRVQVRTDGRRS